MVDSFTICVSRVHLVSKQQMSLENVSMKKHFVHRLESLNYSGLVARICR